MKDFSKETRDVYHAQHTKIAEDGKTMKRFISMFDTEYFGLDEKYFEGKRVLDAGCGDTAKLIIKLHKLGSRELYGCDLGTEFIPVATKTLEKYDVPLNDVKFSSGSVLELPYEDNYFDFVSCHGVLVHLNNLEEVQNAFAELARVTKNDGYLYTVFGSVGGLFEDAINPAIRKYYRENAEFKKFVDNISQEKISEIIGYIAEGMRKHTGEEIDSKLLNELLDIDFSVTIQNITQVPIRLTITEEYIRSNYSKNGFTDVRRLNRYVKRENIRKFFAPLHYEKNYSFSKILYGSGNLEFIARKT